MVRVQPAEMMCNVDVSVSCHHGTHGFGEVACGTAPWVNLSAAASAPRVSAILHTVIAASCRACRGADSASGSQTAGVPVGIAMWLQAQSEGVMIHDI